MLRSSCASKPGGRRTMAPARLSSIGARAVAGAESIVTGNISVAASAIPGMRSGSHLRMTLALIPWLRATADTEAPGARHDQCVVAAGSAESLHHIVN